MASENAIRAGLSWAEFWSYTPYQTRVIAEAWLEDRKLERNLAMTAAYMTARLSMADPKKFPELSEFLGEDASGPQPEQSPEEFSARFIHWAIRHGIEVQDIADT